MLPFLTVVYPHGKLWWEAGGKLKGYTHRENRLDRDLGSNSNRKWNRLHLAGCSSWTSMSHIVQVEGIASTFTNTLTGNFSSSLKMVLQQKVWNNFSINSRGSSGKMYLQAREANPYIFIQWIAYYRMPLWLCVLAEIQHNPHRHVHNLPDSCWKWKKSALDFLNTTLKSMKNYSQLTVKWVFYTWLIEEVFSSFSFFPPQGFWDCCWLQCWGNWYRYWKWCWWGLSWWCWWWRQWWWWWWWW